MRKIILNLAVSLDGFIEGPNGEIDWCFTDQDYGMTDFLNRIDTIFFGRKSYKWQMCHSFCDKRSKHILPSCHCERSEAISAVRAGDRFGKERLARTAPLLVMLEASFLR